MHTAGSRLWLLAVREIWCGTSFLRVCGWLDHDASAKTQHSWMSFAYSLKVYGSVYQPFMVEGADMTWLHFKGQIWLRPKRQAGLGHADKHEVSRVCNSSMLFQMLFQMLC